MIKNDCSTKTKVCKPDLITYSVWNRSKFNFKTCQKKYPIYFLQIYSSSITPLNHWTEKELLEQLGKVFINTTTFHWNTTNSFGETV